MRRLLRRLRVRGRVFRRWISRKSRVGLPYVGQGVAGVLVAGGVGLVGGVGWGLVVGGVLLGLLVEVWNSP